MPEEACKALLEYLLQDEHALRQHLKASIDLTALLNPPSAETRQAPSTDRADPDIQGFGLLGDILWEIFSQNNEVVSLEGRVYDLGSWRGSGSFIAHSLNTRLMRQGLVEAQTIGPFRSIEFYMGLMIPPGDEAWEAPLRLLYAHFFERLKTRGCTWRYAPPAIYLLRFTDDSDEEDPASYDPASAVQKALEEESSEADRAATRRARSDVRRLLLNRSSVWLCFRPRELNIWGTIQ